MLVLSSPSFDYLAAERPPLSVSSACHAHPDDCPHICGPTPTAVSLLDNAYRTHGPALFGFLLRNAGADEALDLMQEVFARAAGSKQRHSLTNPGGFLRRIAQNLLIDRARRARREPAAPFPLDEECDAASPPEQELNIEAEDLLRLYEAAIDDMPPKTRRVFLMHRAEKISYREIHERLGISVATVEYHMMRALAHVASAIESGR